MENALRIACRYPESLTRQQSADLQSGARTIRAHTTASPELVVRAGEYYRARNRIGYTASFIASDWGQIHDFLTIPAITTPQGAAYGQPQTHRRETSVEAEQRRRRELADYIFGDDPAYQGSREGTPGDSDFAAQHAPQISLFAAFRACNGV
jgi:hypothetical protein